MKRISILILISALSFSVSAGVRIVMAETGRPVSAGSETGTLVVKRCADFQVTGDGKNVAWNITDWIMLEQQGNVRSSYETRVKVLYSGTGIYFLFHCGDSKLTTTMTADNLNLWEEDVVEVFLWTSEDFPVYFEYEISPMNFELPIIIPNYKGKFLGWLPWNYYGDKKVLHETSVTGGEKKSGAAVSSWTAEFFIPYKLLEPLPQVPPAPGTRWRANMYRVDYDNGVARWLWQKTTKTFHEYNKFGTFIFG